MILLKIEKSKNINMVLRHIHTMEHEAAKDDEALSNYYGLVSRMR